MRTSFACFALFVTLVPAARAACAKEHQWNGKCSAASDGGATRPDTMKSEPDQAPAASALQSAPQNTSASQSLGPEIQFDTRGVEFRPWIRLFVAQMKRNWMIPWTPMSDKGHVVITFNVQKNGKITDVNVTSPSTIAVFNDNAQAAIFASSPTVPLPAEYPAAQAHFTVTFYYNESPPAASRAQTSAPKPPADYTATSLLAMTASTVEERLGRPTQVDGFRWTYTTTGGVLWVYFNDVDEVIDVQPPSFDLTTVKR